jgi:hypothetical protein
MKAARLATLKFLALLFLLPGLTGLIASAMVSTHYLEVMPKTPDPAVLRVVPRNIHGTVIYQTAQEDRSLMLLQDSSVGVFVVGLALGLVYLEKWGSMQIPYGEETDLAQNGY